MFDLKSNIQVSWGTFESDWGVGAKNQTRFLGSWGVGAKKSNAYADRPLPISYGQTISQRCVLVRVVEQSRS
jgi:hypothetical protein